MVIAAEWKAGQTRLRRSPRFPLSRSKDLWEVIKHFGTDRQALHDDGEL